MRDNMFSDSRKQKKQEPLFIVKVLILVFILVFAGIIVFDRVSKTPVDSHIFLKHFKSYMKEKKENLKPYFPKPYTNTEKTNA